MQYPSNGVAAKYFRVILTFKMTTPEDEKIILRTNQGALRWLRWKSFAFLSNRTNEWFLQL